MLVPLSLLLFFYFVFFLGDCSAHRSDELSFCSSLVARLSTVPPPALLSFSPILCASLWSTSLLPYPPTLPLPAIPHSPFYLIIDALFFSGSSFSAVPAHPPPPTFLFCFLSRCASSHFPIHSPASLPFVFCVGVSHPHPLRVFAVVTASHDGTFASLFCRVWDISFSFSSTAPRWISSIHSCLLSPRCLSLPLPFPFLALLSFHRTDETSSPAPRPEHSLLSFGAGSTRDRHACGRVELGQSAVFLLSGRFTAVQ